MSVEFFALAIGCIGLLLFFVGLLIGTDTERAAWTSRAMPHNQTAHHCDGRFYVVIEEGYFCREYQRKPADEPPHGGE